MYTFSVQNLFLEQNAFGTLLSCLIGRHSTFKKAILTPNCLQDAEEKVWAMQLVTNSVLPGRWYVRKLSFPIWRRDIDLQRKSWEPKTF